MVPAALLAGPALGGLGTHRLLQHDAVAPIVHQVVHRHPAPAVVAAGIGELDLGPQGTRPPVRIVSPPGPPAPLTTTPLRSSVFQPHHLQFHRRHQLLAGRREQDGVQPAQHVPRGCALAVQ